jgi:branched-chain amino acid transport system ATP-binding protein
LSYGVQKRVELARALCLEPELILLDEPMAGMNSEETEDMARYVIDINEEKGVTVILIEHDMNVVMDLSNRVMALEFGEKICEGIPETVAQDKRVVAAYLGEEKWI